MRRLLVECRVCSDVGLKIRIHVLCAFVSLTLCGFGAVQVWKRVNPVRRAVTWWRNMLGAVEFSFYFVGAETSLLSAFRFFLDLCVSSLVAALFESQWSALPTSAHS